MCQNFSKTIASRCLQWLSMRRAPKYVVTWSAVYKFPMNAQIDTLIACPLLSQPRRAVRIAHHAAIHINKRVTRHRRIDAESVVLPATKRRAASVRALADSMDSAVSLARATAMTRLPCYSRKLRRAVGLTGGICGRRRCREDPHIAATAVGPHRKRACSPRSAFTPVYVAICTRVTRHQTEALTHGAEANMWSSACPPRELISSYILKDS